MEQSIDEMVIVVDLGISAGAEHVARSLQGELHSTVADLAREGACGQSLVRYSLEGMAEQLEAAADRQGYWPRHRCDRPALPHESELRAAIARLRLVARN